MTKRFAASRPEDITEEMIAEVDKIIERHNSRPGSLIPVLQQAQEVCGYVPVYLQDRVAKGLGIPGSAVFGVVTFYSIFTMVPRGRHTIRVCLGTACFVRGAGDTLNRVQRELGVPVGGTTEDRRFSLEAVRCLGACGLAPVTVIDRDTHRGLTSDKIMDVVHRYD
ncbi:MAG: NAD(P)H-dependent oxidoreductase subunit E [Pseudomonadota bacterium]